MVEKIVKVICKEFVDGIVVYGIDVLCFILVVLVLNGCDINWDMKCLEGYCNFCNKLWNVSCFVFINEKLDLSEGEIEFLLVDCWI